MVGTAALLGGVLGLIARLRGDPPRRDLALSEIGGGPLLGAVSGTILWLLERGKTKPPAQDR